MRDFWKKDLFLYAVFALAAVGVSVQLMLRGQGQSDSYTAYENYIIFKQSFVHLLAGQNPYADYPSEHWDLFKYSPAFALCMAPFSALPDLIGLSLWNLLNALVPLAAIFALPGLDRGQRHFFAWFILIELVTSLQNSQSNGLTAGLMLWTLVAFERGQLGRAVCWVAAAGFIKIFGFVAAILCLFYPQKKRFVLWLAAWVLILAAAPLLVLSPQQVQALYIWWWTLLRNDHGASVGLSVMGWLQSWFGWQPSKMWVTGVGIALLVASVGAASWRMLHRQDTTTLSQRLLALAAVLIWVVIFNHKAESPTFIIAMCGVSLWFLQSKKTAWEKMLVVTTFVLVSLSPTDIFPRTVRQIWVQPYVLKAVPCILVWFVLTYRLFNTTWTRNLS